VGETLIIIFSGVVALSTVVYALLTWRLVAETRKLREAQFEPNVLVYVQPKEDLISWLDIIVENTGLGPAYDVRLTIKPDIERPSGDALGGMGWFTKGISLLAPRYQLRQGYTFMVHDTEQKLSVPRTVTVTYRNSGGKERVAEYVIDLSEMKGLRQNGTPPAYASAKSLEKLAKAVERMSSDLSKIRVITKTAAEERAEAEEWGKD
jgi:hypothetical protein